MERLKEELDHIDQELCIKMIEPMTERIHKCLKAKGEHFLQIQLYMCRFFCK